MWWIQLDTEATIIGRIIQFELCRGEIATEARNDEKNRKEGISKHIKTENLYILNNGKVKKMDNSTSILFSQTVTKRNGLDVKSISLEENHANRPS